MATRIDLTGQKFGRWVVVRFAEARKSGGAHWLCQCECGTEGIVSGYKLRNGDTVSCGCWRRDSAIEQATTHGLTGSPIYGIWANMRSRTGDPTDPAYANYGGRGITVCDRWQSFEAFHTDMWPTYEPGLSLERVDNGRGYSPDNVIWASAAVQARNKRNNVWITWRGQTRILTDWANLLGLKEATLRKRLKVGWPIDRALTKGADPARLAAIELD